MFNMRHFPQSFRQTAPLAALACATVIVAAGCTSDLETGYHPKPLNSTTADRRSYYAPAFTPEAQAQEKEAQGGGSVRKPSAY